MYPSVAPDRTNGVLGFCLGNTPPSELVCQFSQVRCSSSRQPKLTLIAVDEAVVFRM
jgi:hypothetical protein